jgi:histone deacetylase 1/2
MPWLVQFSKENLWHRQFHTEVGIYKIEGPTVVYEDNQSAISMANNPGVPHKRSKHYGIEFAFFKQSVELGEIVPQYVPTEEQAADMLTKTLTVGKFTEFRDKVMGLNPKQVHFNTQKFTKV